MKRTALLAAAAALFAAAPAAANGYLGGRYTSSDVDVLGTGLDADAWQVEGEFGWTGGFGGQVGGSFGNVDLDGGDSDYWTGNVHLYWDAGSWKIGGVLAHSDFDDVDTDETVLGVEAMFDVSSNANIWGSFTRSEFEFLADFEAWSVDVGGNIYASPNVHFGGYVGTGNVDAGGGADFDTLAFGVNTEFQPWSAPISITLGYNYYDIDDIETGSSSFNIGARWNFGGGTIQDRNNATPYTTNNGNLSRILGVY